MMRQFLDIGIYFSQHTMVSFLVFLGLWMLGIRVFRLDHHLSGLAGRFGRAILLGFTGLFLAVYLFISGWYLILEGFAGEVEPMVSSLSWMVQEGHPLYHAINAPERYSVLYGPSVFLTNGLFLKVLGPSLFATKLASALAGVASLLLIYATTRHGKRDLTAIAMVGLAVIYFWCQGFAVYLVRPDSLLVFSVSFGLFVVVRARRLAAVVALGAVLGFAINLKVHAGFYFLPVLVLLMQRFGWRALWLTGAIAAATVLAPFAFHDQVNLSNYLVWLGNAAGHGLCWTSVLETLRYALGLVLPIAALVMLQEQPFRWIREQVWLLGSLAVSLPVILILAAKPGAGLVHLLPLVPSTLFIVSQLLHDLPSQTWLRADSPGRRPLLGRSVLAAAVLTVVLAGTVHEYRVTCLVAWENQETHDLALDIADIQAAFPGLKIGMAVGGENQNFRHTWLRPLLVFRDSPLLLDPIAVMDCHLAGKDLPLETYEALSRGDVAVWLVPKAQRPFAKVNWYPPHEPVFSTGFMEHFQAHYSPRSQSRFFDVWIWNGLSQEALGEPTLASFRF